MHVYYKCCCCSLLHTATTIRINQASRNCTISLLVGPRDPSGSGPLASPGSWRNGAHHVGIVHIPGRHCRPTLIRACASSWDVYSSRSAVARGKRETPSAVLSPLRLLQVVTHAGLCSVRRLLPSVPRRRYAAPWCLACSLALRSLRRR